MNSYGPVVFISYITILAHLYANGYYLNIELNLYRAHIDLIDMEMLYQNVITLRGIQMRFLKITKKRQNKDLSKYWN
jgi:hypothetical protein